MVFINPVNLLFFLQAMFKTVRTKLLASFLFLMLLCLLSCVLLFRYYTSTKAEIQSFTARLHQLEVLIQKSQSIMQDFFLSETINPAFFKSGESEYFTKLSDNYNEIEKALQSLDSSRFLSRYSLEREVDEINKSLLTWSSSFDTIVNLILRKGFKDYGVEGNLRAYAHELENLTNYLSLTDILQLRRHEKDFMIRNENAYVIKHSQLLEKISANIESLHPFPMKDSIRVLLRNYELSFSQFVELEKKIGLKSKAGMKDQLNRALRNIGADLKRAERKSLRIENEFISKLEYRIAIIVVGIVGTGIFFAFFISRLISNRIIRLKNEIDDFIQSGFASVGIRTSKKTQDEIGDLASKFENMESAILNYISELKETNRDLETFLYRVSHDLKGPLSSISGLINLIEMTKDEKEIDGYHAMISTSIAKLHGVIDELNEVILIRQGKTVSTRINFRVMVDEITSQVQAIPGMPEVIYIVENDRPPVIFVDAMMLRIILRSLIENATKYSKRESVESFVKITMCDAGDSNLSISVEDNGIGIPPEFHDRIFDMFFRATNVSVGSGLGLYIVKNAVVRMKGTINLTSKEGEGSVFTITIP
jgi:signal transduction histidine kinase